MIQPWWFVITGLAFCAGILWLIVSGWIGVQLLLQLLPLLSDTRHQIQELGLLAAHTVDRASATMDLVEASASETLERANEGGAAANRSVVSLAAVVAGIYMVSRFVSTVRGTSKRGKPRHERRWTVRRR